MPPRLRSGCVLVYVVMILGVPWLAGCADSEDRPTSIHHKESRSPPPGTKIMGLHGQARGQSACTSMKIIAGSAAGDIDFVGHCSGSVAGGEVRFIVGRYSLSDMSRRIAITTHAHRMQVTGRGAISRNGVCALERGSLLCSAKVDGPVRVSGRLLVKPKTRCRVGVSVVGITNQSCEEIPCEGGVVLNELSEGRPRGC